MISETSRLHEQDYSEIEIRHFTLSDLADAKQLHRDVFGSDYEVDIVHRRMALEELGGLWLIARNRQSKLVGNYTIANRAMNFQGQRALQASSAGLVMVDKEYRFNQHPARVAMRITEQAIAQGVSKGLEMVSGVGNPSSFPFHVKRFGFAVVGKLEQFKLTLEPETLRQIAPLDGLGSVAELTFAEVTEIPSDYNLLWESAAKHTKVSFWKDHLYQRAQYLSMRDITKVILYILRAANGRLLGFSLVQKGRDRSVIREFIVADGSVSYGNAFLKQMALHESSPERAREIVFTGTPQSLGAQSCQNLFTLQPSERHLIVKLLSDRATGLSELICDINAWDHTIGDRV